MTPTAKDIEAWVKLATAGLPPHAICERMAIANLREAAIQAIQALGLKAPPPATLVPCRLVPKASCQVDGCDCGDVLNHGIGHLGADWSGRPGDL